MPITTSNSNVSVEKSNEQSNKQNNSVKTKVTQGDFGKGRKGSHGTAFYNMACRWIAPTVFSVQQLHALAVICMTDLGELSNSDSTVKLGKPGKTEIKARESAKASLAKTPVLELYYMLQQLEELRQYIRPSDNQVTLWDGIGLDGTKAGKDFDGELRDAANNWLESHEVCPKETKPANS